MEILIVEDEIESCNNLANFIKKMKHNVDVSYNGNDAILKLDKNKYDLVISDVNLPFYNGTDILKIIKDKKYKAEVILISGVDDIIQSINAIDLGILDFLTKPIDIRKLSSLIKATEDNLKKANESLDLLLKKNKLIKINEISFSGNYSIYNDFIGEIGIFSDKMYSIYRKLKKLEEYPHIPVLIEGETGSGKEIIAKYIHYENSKNQGLFVGINCSNLTKELFDSEIFGYDKGAFTGASEKGKEGKIKLAEYGTLFFDEITELSFDLQAKLLRVMQEREYYKIGSSKKEIVTARIIASTNKKIEELVSKNLFREDLYFRLNVCKVTIPPLRERPEEIIPLSLFFIKIICNELGKKIDLIETNALKILKKEKWKGNIRELKNFITKIILFNDRNIISEKVVMDFIQQNSYKKDKSIDLSNLEIPDEPFSLDELNKAIVKKVLEKFKGNKSKTAKFLGLNRIQIYGKYKL